MPVAIVVQVVEFGHRGVSMAQHLDIEMPRDRLDVLGLEARDEAVHLLSPRPEVVRGVAAEFSESRHGPLERVGMHIGDAGKDGARRARVLAGFAAGLDSRDDSGRVPFDKDVARPAGSEQRVGGEE